MVKTADEPYEFNGTRFHLRAFEDPFQVEKPVFVVEEAAGNRNPLAMNRVELAKEFADANGRSPDQITWLELFPDGRLRQVEFDYTHTDRLYPTGRDLDPREAEAAGTYPGMEPVEIARYNTRETEVSRREVQAHVGDALDPYEKRLNQEFRQMRAPAVTVSLDEMQQLPSQHDFENNPDLTF